MIAIGCTGGRHRSVAIAEHLAERYRDHDELDVAVAHRDIDKRRSAELLRQAWTERLGPAAHRLADSLPRARRATERCS